jgi:hypothetical protein
MSSTNYSKKNPFTGCVSNEASILETHSKIGKKIETDKNHKVTQIHPVLGDSTIDPIWNKQDVINPQLSTTTVSLKQMEKKYITSELSNNNIPIIKKQLLSSNSYNINDLYDNMKVLQEAILSFHDENIAQNEQVVYNNNFVVRLQNIFNHSAISYYNKDNNIILLKRHSKKNIMLKFCIDDPSGSKSSIYSFVQLLSETNSNGIAVSLFGEFDSNPDYAIENNYGNLLMYINNMENDGIHKLILAVNANDVITQTMVLNDKNTNYYCIEKNTLHNIYNEYEDFHRKKQELIDSIKQNYNNNIRSLQYNFKCVCLEELLSQNLIQIPKNEGLKCTICNSYNAQNLKALSAHKRGCCKKNKALLPNYELEDYKKC